MLILAGLLMIGLLCNLLIRPVADHWFMSDAELAEEKRLAHEKINKANISSTKNSEKSTPLVIVIVAWIGVIAPLSWGIYNTLINVSKFFN